ncbi:hypothetical protein B0H13DRAFT_2021100 [Mycena leptocephala]|nr:hypothetical protein B0H13DRAFT_2021100 [Mycena leptocephala]
MSSSGSPFWASKSVDQNLNASDPAVPPFKPTGFPTEDMSSSLSYEPLSTRISASTVHNQQQSPLFGTLYPELRDVVFRHVLKEYDDLARPFGKHEYYYRPGFEFAGRIDTNLLLTCRSVYLETHLAPIALNEHVF